MFERIKGLFSKKRVLNKLKEFVSEIDKKTQGQSKLLDQISSAILALLDKKDVEIDVLSNYTDNLIERMMLLNAEKPFIVPLSDIDKIKDIRSNMDDLKRVFVTNSVKLRILQQHGYGSGSEPWTSSDPSVTENLIKNWDVTQQIIKNTSSAPGWMKNLSEFSLLRSFANKNRGIEAIAEITSKAMNNPGLLAWIFEHNKYFLDKMINGDIERFKEVGFFIADILDKPGYGDIMWKLDWCKNLLKTPQDMRILAKWIIENPDIRLHEQASYVHSLADLDPDKIRPSLGIYKKMNLEGISEKMLSAFTHLIRTKEDSARLEQALFELQNKAISKGVDRFKTGFDTMGGYRIEEVSFIRYLAELQEFYRASDIDVLKAQGEHIMYIISKSPKERINDIFILMKYKWKKGGYKSLEEFNEYWFVSVEILGQCDEWNLDRVHGFLIYIIGIERLNDINEFKQIGFAAAEITKKCKDIKDKRAMDSILGLLRNMIEEQDYINSAENFREWGFAAYEISSRCDNNTSKVFDMIYKNIKKNITNPKDMKLWGFAAAEIFNECDDKRLDMIYDFLIDIVNMKGINSPYDLKEWSSKALEITEKSPGWINSIQALKHLFGDEIEKLKEIFEVLKVYSKKMRWSDGFLIALNEVRSIDDLPQAFERLQAMRSDKRYWDVNGLKSMNYLVCHVTNAFAGGSAGEHEEKKDAFNNLVRNILINHKEWEEITEGNEGRNLESWGQLIEKKKIRGLFDELKSIGLDTNINDFITIVERGDYAPRRYNPSCSIIGTKTHTGLAVTKRFGINGAIGILFDSGYIYQSYSHDSSTKDVIGKKSGIRIRSGNEPRREETVLVVNYSQSRYNEVLLRNWSVGALFYTKGVEGEHIDMLKKISDILSNQEYLNPEYKYRIFKFGTPKYIKKIFPVYEISLSPGNNSWKLVYQPNKEYKREAKQEYISKISFNRHQLESVIDMPIQDFISIFKNDFPELFSMSVGVHEGYSLEDHTKLVLTQFDRYFSNKPLPGNVTKTLFRTLLVLHDLGKPMAVQKGNKHLQHEETSKIVRPILEQLEFSGREISISLSLIGGDPIGEYIKGENVYNTLKEIRNMAGIAGLPVNEFFELLLIYYKCDAGSYTSDSGGIRSLDWIFVFDHANLRIDFSEAVNGKIEALRKELGA
jgi:hypothetical protein